MNQNSLVAVGDIHGRFDLLQDLLAQIEASEFKDYKIVFLGDMTDRGPDSFQVVDTVKKLCEAGKAEAILGNHEEMMMAYHNKRIVNPNDIWLYNGGRKTIDSYTRSMKMYGMAQFFSAFEKSGHAAWMRALPYYYETDKVWISHAPIPEEKIRKQFPLFSHIHPREGDFRADKDLLTWTYVPEDIAAEGTWEHYHGKIALCGHIHALRRNILEPRIFPEIIYADTGSGCAPWGRLTGVVVTEGAYKTHFQAKPNVPDAAVRVQQGWPPNSYDV